MQTLKVPAAPDEVPAKTVFGSRVAIDPLAPETLYAGALGVLKSTDGGTTWRSAGLCADAGERARSRPGSAGDPLCRHGRGPLQEHDAGASWQALLADVRVEALAIDPQQRQTVYAGTDRGVFWTADGGQSWRRFTRLPVREFDALAIDPAAGMVYAGTYGGGIYELKLTP